MNSQTLSKGRDQEKVVYRLLTGSSAIAAGQAVSLDPSTGTAGLDVQIASNSTGVGLLAGVATKACTAGNYFEVVKRGLVQVSVTTTSTGVAVGNALSVNSGGTFGYKGAGAIGEPFIALETVTTNTTATIWAMVRCL